MVTTELSLNCSWFFFGDGVGWSFGFGFKAEASYVVQVGLELLL